MSGTSGEASGFQTQTVLRSLLEASGLSPRKQFGQNFLIDQNLMRKLVESAELTPTDCVLEVGHGTGSLTSLLANEAGWVVAVDVDPKVAEIAHEWLADRANVEFICQDALENKSTVAAPVYAALTAALQRLQGNLKLVANLPYDIATPLIINLLLGEPRFERLCFTVQDEVGDRFLAAPDTSDYGPVGIISQMLATGHRTTRVPPQAFWPPPKVTSAMLRLDVRPREQVPVNDLTAFAHFVRSFFLHRRKTMTSISKMLEMEQRVSPALKQLGLSAAVRPEVVTVEQWVELFRAVS